MGHVQSLDERYRDDPELLAFYKKKLLVPGWAGEVDDVEAAYIAEELTRSQKLRRLWRVGKFTRYRKKITPAVAKRLAGIWAEMPLSGVETLATRTDRTKTTTGETKSITRNQLDFLATLENGHGRR